MILQGRSNIVVGIIKSKPEDMDMIVTGRVLTDNVRALADEVYRIDTE